MKIATTIPNEMVDAICRKNYGDESIYVEAVLEANRGLADLGPLLPRGTPIVLPEIKKVAEVVPVVSLWD